MMGAALLPHLKPHSMTREEVKGKISDYRAYLVFQFDQEAEGPMQNSYLRLRKDPSIGSFHPVLRDLEDAFRIINAIYRVKVVPEEFPSPVTLSPTYPDLPMEMYIPRSPETDIRELYA